jgi:hypothetical protein
MNKSIRPLAGTAKLQFSVLQLHIVPVAENLGPILAISIYID